MWTNAYKFFKKIPRSKVDRKTLVFLITLKKNYQIVFKYNQNIKVLCLNIMLLHNFLTF